MQRTDFAECFASLRGSGYGLAPSRKITLHKCDAAAFHGYIGACSHGNADVCLSESRFDDDLKQVVGRWRKTLVNEIARAIEDGDLPSDLDPEQAAFSLEALAAGMNPARQLYGDTSAAAWSLQAMRAVLGVRAG